MIGGSTWLTVTESVPLSESGLSRLTPFGLSGQTHIYPTSDTAPGLATYNGVPAPPTVKNDPMLAGPSGTGGETVTSTTGSGVMLTESPATAKPSHTPSPTPSTSTPISISTIITPVPTLTAELCSTARYLLPCPGQHSFLLLHRSL